MVAANTLGVLAAAGTLSFAPSSAFVAPSIVSSVARGSRTPLTSCGAMSMSADIFGEVSGTPLPCHEMSNFVVGSEFRVVVRNLTRCSSVLLGSRKSDGME